MSKFQAIKAALDKEALRRASLTQDQRDQQDRFLEMLRQTEPLHMLKRQTTHDPKDKALYRQLRDVASCSRAMVITAKATPPKDGSCVRST